MGSERLALLLERSPTRLQPRPRLANSPRSDVELTSHNTGFVSLDQELGHLALSSRKATEPSRKIDPECSLIGWVGLVVPSAPFAPGVGLCARLSPGVAVEAKYTEPEAALGLGLKKIGVASTARAAGKTAAAADVSGSIESNSSWSDSNRILTAAGYSVPGVPAGGNSIVESFSPESAGPMSKVEPEGKFDLWQSLLELALDSVQGIRVKASD
jgi:hypothetical protein